MAGNPYLQDQANAITQQATQNLQNNILPGINSGAMMAGGFGGSRQGIAQGLAIGQTNQGITNSLASLYGNAYEGDQNRANQQSMQQAALASQQQIAAMNDATQRFGLQNQYNLGLGNLGLGQYNAETSRGLGYGQLAQQGEQNAFNNQLAGYGAQLQGLNSLMNWNNLGMGWANQQQQIPLQNLSQLSNIGASIGGQGGTATTPYYGNPWLGALGGAQLGGSLFGNLFSGGK